jgi:hypothetical protein
VVNAYLAGLAGFGQGNVHVKVEHKDSIERCLEVSNKGSFGWLRLLLAKVFEHICSRWSTEGAQDRDTEELFAKLK